MNDYLSYIRLFSRPYRIVPLYTPIHHDYAFIFGFLVVFSFVLFETAQA